MTTSSPPIRFHSHAPIHPKAPTANLVSCKVLVSLVGQISICGSFQLWAFWYTRRQPWYQSPTIDPDNLNTQNPENSALFFISSFQYIVGCLVYSTGYPYRKPIYTNAWLMIAVFILLSFSTFALFVRQGFIFDLLGLVWFPASFHWSLFIAIISNTLLCFLFEYSLANYVVKSVKALQRLIKRSRKGSKTRKHGSKLYKAVERSFQIDGDA